MRDPSEIARVAVRYLPKMGCLVNRPGKQSFLWAVQSCFWWAREQYQTFLSKIFTHFNKWNVDKGEKGYLQFTQFEVHSFSQTLQVLLQFLLDFMDIVWLILSLYVMWDDMWLKTWWVTSRRIFLSVPEWWYLLENRNETGKSNPSKSVTRVDIELRMILYPS